MEPQLQNLPDDESLRAFVVARADYVWLIGMIHPLRTGVRVCFSAIEYCLYPPNTAANAGFELVIIEWQNIFWHAVGVPKADQERWQPYVRAGGLRMAAGVPTMVERSGVVDSGVIDRFPLDYPNCYHLTWLRYNPAYDEDQRPEIEALEARLLDRIWNHGWQPSPRELELVFAPWVAAR